MKNTYFCFFIFALVSFSCSGLATVATLTPAPTSTNIPTDIPSSTPTIPTSTFTNTPTLVGVKKETPTTEFTFTPEAVTQIFLITPNTPTPTPQMKGFLRVNVSGAEFYMGKECQPTSVKFTAQVSDIVNTAYVLLFVRFKSKQSGVVGDWSDSIKMESIGAGTYVHDLVVTELKGVGSFQNPWVQYQFVATKANTREIGRTEIFSERLSLLDCKPTPTPSLSPTPTVLKP